VTVADHALQRADEVEDFQAVGVRLREALVSLAQHLASVPEVRARAPEELKGADFKGWADTAAGTFAAGRTSAELRSLLKTVSEKTWIYVNWLTHTSRANRPLAALGLDMTGQVVTAFISAMSHWRVGSPDACAWCGSLQVKVEETEPGVWTRRCVACSREEVATEPDHGAYTLTEPTDPPPVVDEDCIEPGELGIYISPREASAMLEKFDGESFLDDR
jgi:hypothetical protein